MRRAVHTLLLALIATLWSAPTAVAQQSTAPTRPAQTQPQSPAPTNAPAADEATQAEVDTATEADEQGLFFKTPPALSGSKFTSVSNVVEWLFNVAITIGAIALIVLLLVGGVMYLTNAGNEDGTKKAFRLMSNAVIGLVLILIAWALGTYVLELLGLRLS